MSNKSHKSKQSSKIGGRESSRVSVSLGTSEILRIPYLEGTSGAGRIAATTKAGLEEHASPTSLSEWMTGFLDQRMVSRVHFAPSLGALWFDGQRSALYSAMFRYFTYIRSKNASLGSYSMFDVFKCLFSVSQIFMDLSAIRAKLRVLGTYGNPVNNAFPIVLREAYGITTNDLRNLNESIGIYNRIVKAMDALFVPHDFAIGKRHMAIAGLVYLDDPIIDKSQLYVFIPEYYYVWDINPTSPDVGKLVPTRPKANIYDELLSLETIVNGYMMDQDINNIYAELRKAFDVGERLTLSTYPLDGEPVQAEFSQVLLDQLKNATLVGEIDTSTAYVQENATSGYLEYAGSTIKCSPWTAWGDADLSDITGQRVRNPNTYYHPLTHAENGIPQGETQVYSHDNQPDEENMAILLYWKARVGMGFGVTPFAEAIFSHTTEILTHIELLTEFTDTAVKYDAGSGDDVLFGDNSFEVSDFTSFNYFYASLSSSTADSICQYELGLEKAGTFSNFPVFLTIFNVDEAGNELTSCVLHEGDIDNRFYAPWQAVDEVHKSAVMGVIGSYFMSK